MYNSLSTDASVQIPSPSCTLSAKEKIEGQQDSREKTWAYANSSGPRYSPLVCHLLRLTHAQSKFHFRRTYFRRMTQPVNRKKKKKKEKLAIKTIHHHVASISIGRQNHHPPSNRNKIRQSATHLRAAKNCAVKFPNLQSETR